MQSRRNSPLGKVTRSGPEVPGASAVRAAKSSELSASTRSTRSTTLPTLRTEVSTVPLSAGDQLEPHETGETSTLSTRLLLQPVTRQAINPRTTTWPDHLGDDPVRTLTVDTAPPSPAEPDYRPGPATSWTSAGSHQRGRRRRPPTRPHWVGRGLPGSDQLIFSAGPRSPESGWSRPRRRRGRRGCGAVAGGSRSGGGWRTRAQRRRTFPSVRGQRRHRE